MNKSLLCILLAAVCAGSLSILPAQATPFPSSPTAATFAAPAEEHLTFRTGRSWRGEIGDRVRVEFTENGVTQTLDGTLTRVEKRYLQVEGEIAGQTAVKTIFLSDVRDMTSIDGAAAGPRPKVDDAPTTGGGRRPSTPSASSASSAIFSIS